MDDYKKQIEQFYNGTMPSDNVIHIGTTPKILQDLGAQDLQVIMLQRNLRKSIREAVGAKTGHQIGREIIESLPEYLKNPVMLVKNESKNSLIEIIDARDFNENSIVVAVHINQKAGFQRVNEIKSVYGRERFKEYILRQEKEGNLYVVDNKKANELLHSEEHNCSRRTQPISYNQSIKGSETKVNTNQQKKPEIVRKIKQAGFQPTKQMINNIIKLNDFTGKNNSLRDISRQYRNLRDIKNPEEKRLITEIGKECRIQELSRVPDLEI